MQGLLAHILMLVAGVGIPVMAALNAHLGARLQSPLAAVAVLSGVALVFTLGLMATQPRANWQALSSAPPPLLLAGLLFVLYIGGITWTAPRIGLGNAVLMVLVGQLVSAALIDHFGLAGAIAAPLTFQRVTGLSLVVIGALLARKDLAGP
ncbi:MAG: DMT family transporter [Burkholderiales bacterium]|nr:DMT family transporter [Burkholderiales bacterium]